MDARTADAAGTGARGWHGPILALLLDSGCWTVGLLVAVVIRHAGPLSWPQVGRALAVAVMAIGLQSTIGSLLRLYGGRPPRRPDRSRALSATVVVTAALLLAYDVGLAHRPVPASAALLGGATALTLMFIHRSLPTPRRRGPRVSAAATRPAQRGGTPALLFGAGAAGHQLIAALLRDPKGTYLPVGLLDDDPDKRHLTVHGIGLLGGRRDIAAALVATGATTVIFAVANADAHLIRDVRRVAVAAGARFKMVPSAGELLSSRASLTDVRDVRMADLVARRQIGGDRGPASRYLTGRRVLVTGAGGIIGAELCRQLQLFDPAELIMLDRDESALHALTPYHDLDDLVLADLRDGDAIREIFAARRPQVVFHAGGLGHLPLLERHPAHALRTNVWGTQTVLDAAREAETFVNLSSTKAANPISVLGYTKRITERLTAHAATPTGGAFCSVRFGNVLGGRGSLLSRFAAQAAAGGPITVADPGLTRYLVTVQEAVALIIQAGAIGGGGQVLLADMGEPVRVADLAGQLTEQSIPPVAVVHTGLRPGEKLRDELFGAFETGTRGSHPLIAQVPVPALDPDRVWAIDPGLDPTDLAAELERLSQAPPPAISRSAPVLTSASVPAERRDGSHAVSDVAGALPNSRSRPEN
jgi:FlaA1/EpsC-like NDP-sugar epimerase